MPRSQPGPADRPRPAPGQESVWDYPRPPRIEPTARRLRVEHGGVVIAETTRGLRVLETSHPPVYYFPPEDVRREHLEELARRTQCEWKGTARYFDVVVGATRAPGAAFSYPRPTAGAAPLAGYLSFYARPLDACFVDGERVEPQPGPFYSGWITSDLVGPFKGPPGTEGW